MGRWEKDAEVKADREHEEVTNETKRIDFSLRRDHSVQPSVFGGFKALKRRNNRRKTPRAGV